MAHFNTLFADMLIVDFLYLAGMLTAVVGLLFIDNTKSKFYVFEKVWFISSIAFLMCGFVYMFVKDSLPW